MSREQSILQEIPGGLQPSHAADTASKNGAAIPFDFRRLDRLPKSQLNTIQFLHERLTRAIVSSLTVFLRAYVSGALAAVEQKLYAEFLDSLPSSTCAAALAMTPYDGYALVTITPSLAAPMLERLLGGNGKNHRDLDREITEVEQSMMEDVFRVFAHELTETWKPVVPVSFAVDRLEPGPQLSKRIPRNESAVIVTMKLQLADRAGTVSLAIPSIALRLLHQRFDQHCAVHRSGSQETELAIRHRMAQELILQLDCELRGATMRLGELETLQIGDVINLGIPTDSSATMIVCGKPKFKAAVTPLGSRLAVTIESVDDR